jgi:hypothetical protein
MLGDAAFIIPRMRLRPIPAQVLPAVVW